MRHKRKNILDNMNRTLVQKMTVEETIKKIKQDKNKNIKNKIREDVGKVDLEILLLNTLTR